MKRWAKRFGADAGKTIYVFSPLGSTMPKTQKAIARMTHLVPDKRLAYKLSVWQGYDNLKGPVLYGLGHAGNSVFTWITGDWIGPEIVDFYLQNVFLPAMGAGLVENTAATYISAKRKINLPRWTGATLGNLLVPIDAAVRNPLGQLEKGMYREDEIPLQEKLNSNEEYKKNMTLTDALFDLPELIVDKDVKRSLSRIIKRDNPRIYDNLKNMLDKYSALKTMYRETIRKSMSSLV